MNIESSLSRQESLVKFFCVCYDAFMNESPDSGGYVPIEPSMKADCEKDKADILAVLQQKRKPNSDVKAPESVVINEGWGGKQATAGVKLVNKSSVKLCLNCDCHNPRCMVWFEYEYEEGSCFSNAPFLEISIQYCHPRGVERIKAAWKLLRTGDEVRDADVCLNGEENIKKLKEFVEKCLDKNSENLE